MAAPLASRDSQERVHWERAKPVRQGQGPALQVGGQVTIRGGHCSFAEASSSCLRLPPARENSARETALVTVPRNSPQHLEYDGGRPTKQEHAVHSHYRPKQSP